MRKFDTGATRNSDDGKFDYEAFENPIVTHSFAGYMHGHRKQADGKMRDGDNWQKGIPFIQLMKSLARHYMDVWLIHRGFKVTEDGKEVDMVEALNGLKFNINAMILDLLKDTKEVERNSS